MAEHEASPWRPGAPGEEGDSGCFPSAIIRVALVGATAAVSLLLPVPSLSLPRIRGCITRAAAAAADPDRCVILLGLERPLRRVSVLWLRGTIRLRRSST
ncbi:hypothetical protein GQ55_2G018100 [Panicum hallii var. hallii]|uniref:Uncharacterized protein n=1 Tax=Panicum hallii var. hallii TaxID=1504633 RepID=A0A2T7EKH5_9POAL|nr:hypothetical protein GQ55_2G018100 [Panicum hallii var. hallii]